MSDCLKLMQRGLISPRNTETTMDVILSVHIGDMEPKFLRLEPLGQLMFELVSLTGIEERESEYEKVVGLFRAIALTGKERVVIDGGANWG